MAERAADRFSGWDSRPYRCRQGRRLALVTRDQTLYQQAIDAGRIEGLGKRNLLSRAMGPATPIKAGVKTFAMEPGDLFMLCFDGLHGSVTHGAIEAVLAAARAYGIEIFRMQFIASAKTDGRRDKITVVLVVADPTPVQVQQFTALGSTAPWPPLGQAPRHLGPAACN